MKQLSWKPVRRGNIYCAPACGAKCTWQEYQKAKRDAEKLKKLLDGTGWEIRVSENMGWYYSISNSYMSVHYSAPVRKFWCLLNIPGLQQGLRSAYFKDPNKAVALELKHARQRVNGMVTALDICEKATTNDTLAHAKKEKKDG